MKRLPEDTYEQIEMNRIEFIQKFLEELDEMVYISDMDTYEIVYLNRKLREALGFERQEDYAGKKCYEVLQGYKIPCSFCNNGELEKGKYVSWVYSNPVLKRKFLVKDSMISSRDSRYRIEIAIDADSENLCGDHHLYARSEGILNECMQQIFMAEDPEQALEQILAYLGKTFLCDRMYVFEFEGQEASNTYEWCEEGVSVQRDILQKISLRELDWWLQIFEKNETLIIRDLEEIRRNHPSSYAVLKPQNISNLIAGPIRTGGRIAGFFGMDNPDREMLPLLSPLMNVLGYFIASLLRRRDLLRNLKEMSFRDMHTGVFNCNAMLAHKENWSSTATLGIIYCDVTGLKRINDTLGHEAGDQLIRQSCMVMREVLETSWIYRMGGDEFVAVFADLSEAEFREKVQKLKERVRQEENHLAVGYVWSDQSPFPFDRLLSEADKNMYRDKEAYYASGKRRKEGVEESLCYKRSTEEQERKDSLFHHFLDTTYHDMEQLFQSISQQNTAGYFYFGDMQKDLFFISDNMRDEFGFQSNVVPGLLKAWSQRIVSAKSKEMYQKEIESMLREKRSIHDLRYQVRDIRGKNMWIRCYGVLKWNEDKTVPLFFSGRITHQDEQFVVDPVTNFPREEVMFRRLDELKGNKQSVLIIGFCLNSITELNSTRGRSYSNHLIESIAQELVEKLFDKMTFYRLEGMRCMAIVDPSCRESKEELVSQIREIIAGWYRIMGVAVRNPCSFALMEYPHQNLMLTDFIEQMIQLLRMAKQEGSQTYVEYSQANIEKIKSMSNMALALSRDVLHGMDNFRIVVQPVVSSKDGKIKGGETLLRWKFEGKDVSPAVFIPMLEKEKMIHIAGRWVFEQAVCTCMRLLSCCPDFYLTFNVSLNQMGDEYFPDFMEEILTKYQLNGSYLIAEMTESCMDEQPEKLLSFVNVCNEMGIRIALDDFGSGYSSLRMLLQYPSNIIKLDRSLLGEMTESADKMNFISSIVYACHRFGKEVCMEGVETKEQDVLIKEAECDMIQGYYYYRPLEIEDMYILFSRTEEEE